MQYSAALLYTALYMASTRTQIYLTPELRSMIDDVMRRERKSMAQVIREALALYLAEKRPAPDAALKSTFGSMPALSVPPRGEWERG